ncbi:MAG TPA: nickel-binding protein [Gaiellaceae bacterium]
MPLFMDRHDLPDLTAEDVAKAHAEDLKVAGKHDVAFLSYWFDPDLGAAFCLARAPAAENVAQVHEEAHGLIPNEIINASEDAILRFLGKVREPTDQSEIESAFRTILFTDLEDSTALADELGSTDYMNLLKEHDRIIRRSLLGFHGREVKHTGDGIMASFYEVADALDAALAIQEAFRERIAAGMQPPHRVRIGLACGEPVDHDNDLFGPTVNLASRICGLAPPGDVLVSAAVDELGLTTGFLFDGGAPVSLKGFAEPVHVFRLVGKQGAD